VRTLGKPLDQKVAADHKRIFALLMQLRQVTNQYNFKDGACTNHQVIYHKLRELDNDLVQHKHLENNYLLPKVLQMERELLQV
jgi:regulator of cell morphogenesis and NO signaling